MPQITGQLLDGAGNGLVAAITFDTVGDPVAVSGGAVRARARITTTTTATGSFSALLAGGAWRMRWQAGALISEAVITMPPAGGPYALADLMFYRAPDPALGITWFSSIAEMLATSASTWRDGRTRNSYGTDGIVSGWDLLLKTDSAASGLTANGDSILETDDTLGLCIRKWIAS